MDGDRGPQDALQQPDRKAMGPKGHQPGDPGSTSACDFPSLLNDPWKGERVSLG